LANTYVNKVIFGNDTLIDISADTITAAGLLAGLTAHDKSGAPIVGQMPSLADATSDATASASDLLSGTTAYVNGLKITGSMTNRGSVTGVITTKNQVYSIQSGFHDGSGTVSISSTEQAKIVAGNIKNGVEILGVTGDYTGSEQIRATTVNATPYITSQTILPSDLGNYNYFTQVTVAAIAKTEVDNASGGKTVTIGTVAPSS